MLFASNDDAVYAPDNEAWAEHLRAILGSKINITNNLQNSSGTYQPWGWDSTIRQQLIHFGANEQDLPSVADINTLRTLSHRRTTVAIHNALGSEFVPIECTTIEEIEQFLIQHGEVFLKAPWSSSGRGIIHVIGTLTPSDIRWCHGIIKRQGSVMCEKALKKKLDFAMEFFVANGKATFAGYSMFCNDNHNSYDYGILAPQVELQQILTSKIPSPTLLSTIRTNLERILTDLLGTCYNGYCGIDMMLYEDMGEIKINPCVELNLRMTFGAVAMILGEKISGKLFIRYYPNKPELPIGAIPLTPILQDTHYVAFVIPK